MNEADDERRAAKIVEVIDDSFAFTDPRSDASGIDAFNDVVGGFHARKGADDIVFRRHNVPLSHHDLVYYTWQMGPAVGPPLYTGRAVLVTNGERITRAYGFWDAMPEPA